MISRWFESDALRELRETRELIEAFNAQLRAFQKSDPEWIEGFLTRVIPAHLPDEIADDIDEYIRDLLERDGPFIPYPLEDIDLGDLSPQERRDLRENIRRRLRVLKKGEQHVKLLEGLLRWLLDELYGHITFGKGSQLEVPVCYLKPDFTSFFTRYIQNLVCDEFRESELLYVEHAKLRRQEALSGKKPIWPDDQHNSDPYALIDEYLPGSFLGKLCTGLVPLTIPAKSKLEHTQIIGGSGHGKTELLKLLAFEELEEVIVGERSILIMDSQGDMQNALLRIPVFHPEHGALSDRLIIIDPTDIERPPCLNLFSLTGEGSDPLSREMTRQSAVSLYEYLFGELLGAELTQRQGTLFAYLAHLMMEIPGATIHTLRDVLEHGETYRPYMEKLEGSAHAFFRTKFFEPAFGPVKTQIVNRLWGVLATGTLDRMFSNKEMKIDFGAAFQAGSVILVNTSKELLKSEGSAFFGKFILSLVSHAIIERAGIKERDRTAVSLYIDEAHEYLDDVLIGLLNQSRKYKVGITLVSQNLDQFSSELKSTVAASTSIKFAGGISEKDARALAGDMRTSSSFLMERTKEGRITDFALYVRGITPSAVPCFVPLGLLESPRWLSDDDLLRVREKNRRRYGALPLPWTPPPSSKELAPFPAPAVREVAPPLAPLPPAQEGKGSREHLYLQSMMKTLGEEAGYRGTLEHKVEGGFVDVWLERGSESIAIEIALNTDPAYELRNLRKCLAENPSKVLCVSPNKAHLGRLRKLAEGSGLPLQDVFFISPEEATMHILTQSSPKEGEPETKIVKGYSVRVKRVDGDSQDAAQRRKRIAGVIAESLRRGG